MKYYRAIPWILLRSAIFLRISIPWDSSPLFGEHVFPGILSNTVDHGCFHRSGTVDGNQKSGIHSPVEVKVAEISLFLQGL